MFQLLLNYIHEYCDAPRPWGLYFQDSAAPQMEGLVELHDNIMFYLIIILFGVGWVLVSVITNYNSVKSPISHKYLNHGRRIYPYTITKIKTRFPGNIDSKLETSKIIGPVIRMHIRLLHEWKNHKNKLHPFYVTGFIDASTKSIVVFGTNLTSTVGIKFSRIPKPESYGALNL